MYYDVNEHNIRVWINNENTIWKQIICIINIIVCYLEVVRSRVFNYIRIKKGFTIYFTTSVLICEMQFDVCNMIVLINCMICPMSHWKRDFSWIYHVRYKIKKYLYFDGTEGVVLLICIYLNIIMLLSHSIVIIILYETNLNITYTRWLNKRKFQNFLLCDFYSYFIVEYLDMSINFKWLIRSYKHTTLYIIYFIKK